MSLESTFPALIFDIWQPVLPNGLIFSDFGPNSDFFGDFGPKMVRIGTQKSYLEG